MKFLALAALLAAAPALAQEDDGTTIRVEKPSIWVVSDCDRPLGLCFSRAKKAAAAPLPPRRRAGGAFDKMTRLAGMFMGRVQAAEVGSFRLRVKLDLK